MKLSEIYRKNAENCAYLAEGGRDEPTRQRYKRMESAWRSLADEQDCLMENRRLYAKATCKSGPREGELSSLVGAAVAVLGTTASINRFACVPTSSGVQTSANRAVGAKRARVHIPVSESLLAATRCFRTVLFLKERNRPNGAVKSE
jgi:hypothetical protein